MAKSRKTADVADVIEVCNKHLKNKNMSDEYRQGIISVLEYILFSTNNYAGYNYLAWCEEKGEDGLTGCERWRKDSAEAGGPMWRDTVPALPTTPYLGNETRRVYYTNRKLLSSPTSTHSAPEDTDIAYPKGLYDIDYPEPEGLGRACEVGDAEKGR